MEAKEIVRAVFYEWVSREPPARVPEPELIMDDPGQVAAYSEATKPEGLIASLYLLFAALVSEIVRPGDTVLDLGCGAGNHLVLAARLNPSVRFIASDLSEKMLATAKANLRGRGIGNVEFQTMDMTNMNAFGAASVDAVISNLAIHHLPSFDALTRVNQEIQRVLKPGGGICVVDFVQMRSLKTVEIFARQYKDVTAEIVVRDYYNSLRAAFTRRELLDAANGLGDFVRFHFMRWISLIFAMRSGTRREIPPEIEAQMVEFYQSMAEAQKSDFQDLIKLLGLRRLKRLCRLPSS